MHNLPGFRAGTLRLPYQNIEKVRTYLGKVDPLRHDLVAVLDGVVIGHATLLRSGMARMAHCGSIGIGVHDAYYGKGVGTALMAAVIDLADNWMNLQRLSLFVFTDNAPALKLYQKFGFEIEAVEPKVALRAGERVGSYAMARLRGALPPAPPWPVVEARHNRLAAVTLRGAEASDAEALAELGNLPNVRRGTLRLPFTRAEELAPWFTGEGKHAIAAEIGGKVVGFAMLRLHSGRRAQGGALDLLFVHDDWTGCGVGRALLLGLLDLADHWLGLRRIELTVDAGNAAAIALYRSAGFFEQGRLRADHFREGGFADGLSMVRLLSNPAHSKGDGLHV